MDDRTARLESAVEHLAQTVLALQHRLEALEGLRPTGGAAPGPGPISPEPKPDALAPRKRSKDPYDPIAILSLVGRLLLVLAGGFFLRAMTEAGVLADAVGVALAFAYGGLWLFMSDRAGRRGQVPAAVVHALAATLIAFPLLVEATTRFKVLSGAVGAIVLAVLSAGLLLAAWRGRLRPVAWITVFGALPAAFAIAIQTGIVAPYALCLVVFGVACLCLSYPLGNWRGRWLAALAADVAVVGVTLRAVAPEPLDQPQAAMVLQGLLLLGYGATIVVRTLVRGRIVSLFEAAQTAAVLVVSLAGAVMLARGSDGLPVALGLMATAVGAAAYAAAVLRVGPRERGAPNFHFYASLGLVLVLAGLALAIGGHWLGAIFALLGLGAIGLWSRRGRLFLLLHGAVYMVAAGIAAGALGYCMRTLVAGSEGAWVEPDVVMLLVMVATAFAALLAATRATGEGDETAAGARFLLVILFVWMAAGTLAGYIAPLAGSLADHSVDPGVLATVRTGVLSVTTLVIAALSRHTRFREWGWLVYPLLVGIGLKLVTQDFKNSRPATLFVALAIYGVALIIAPRLRRSPHKEATPPAPQAP